MRKRGFNHLGAVAREMPDVASRIVEKATVDIAAGAGATAPIDTGALAASYTAEVSGLEGTAGSNMEYAPYVEFGTSRTGAQPHLVPAAERVVDALRGQAAKTFGRQIEETARRG